jgi:hypothetical protein
MIILTVFAIVFMLAVILIAGFLSVVCVNAFCSYAYENKVLPRVTRVVGVIVTGLSVLATWLVLGFSIVLTAHLVRALVEMIVWFAQ